jgi:hypothetical protein
MYQLQVLLHAKRRNKPMPTLQLHDLDNKKTKPIWKRKQTLPIRMRKMRIQKKTRSNKKNRRGDEKTTKLENILTIIYITIVPFFCLKNILNQEYNNLILSLSGGGLIYCAIKMVEQETKRNEERKRFFEQGKTTTKPQRQ